MNDSYDIIWDELGKKPNKYPYDSVVSFVYLHAPPDKKANQIKILEVGCSGANNLWFAAREGFQVAGIDGSQAAIDHAKRRFAEEKLQGDLRQGNFIDLPWQDQSFDLVIDRGAITCTSYNHARKALSEIHRVLKSGGKFLFTPYSNQHSSAASGEMKENGLVVNIRGGSLIGTGQVCFYSAKQVDSLLREENWSILQYYHHQLDDQIHDDIRANWRVIVQKK